jgi:hypothetical protein
MPLDVLTQRAADEGTQDGAEIDPHVEDREPGVASRTMLLGAQMGLFVVPDGLGTGVEIPDHRADVGLEQARADHDEHESREERGSFGQPHQRPRHGEVAEGDDAAADEHRSALAPEVVRHPPAWEGQQVDHGRVEAVDRPRLGRTISEPGVGNGDRCGHEEHQERPHSVVGKPFPHLGEEQGGQTAGMAEEGCLPDRILQRCTCGVVSHEPILC